jgi:hypothetical protein
VGAYTCSSVFKITFQFNASRFHASEWIAILRLSTLTRLLTSGMMQFGFQRFLNPAGNPVKTRELGNPDNFVLIWGLFFWTKNRDLVAKFLNPKTGDFWQGHCQGDKKIGVRTSISSDSLGKKDLKIMEYV